MGENRVNGPAPKWTVELSFADMEKAGVAKAVLSLVPPEELNRRRAVVYTHPIIPLCCVGLIKGVSSGTIEFATDTTRTIASLILGAGGTAFRCPDIKFIWSHSGGTLPFLIGRFIREQIAKKGPTLARGTGADCAAFSTRSRKVASQGSLRPCIKLIPVSRLMFGSDFPFREAREVVHGLGAYGFSAADRASIDRETALRLLPRFAD